jgi:hypothetical protein
MSLLAHVLSLSRGDLFIPHERAVSPLPMGGMDKRRRGVFSLCSLCKWGITALIELGSRPISQRTTGGGGRETLLDRNFLYKKRTTKSTKKQEKQILNTSLKILYIKLISP